MKLVALILLLGSACAETHVYVKDGGSETAGKPTQTGRVTVGQDSFVLDVLQIWMKTRECENVSPVMASEGANYTATLKSSHLGLKSRVSYIVTDSNGRVIAAKTVTPKNAAKDICNAVKAETR